MRCWCRARFSYSKNMAARTRTVLEDEVFTALYGFARGLAIVGKDGAANDSSNWAATGRRFPPATRGTR